ncbi:MAG: DMT family transporter [Actinobacteria bacterium]|nr:DMT family transporter [Actinomycetota bacterium]MBV8395439.1 DMT family transporter [Actinomycetota bacterium]
MAARARADLLPIAAALVAVVLWASAFVGIRSAAGPLGPGPLALLRLVVGSAVLGLLLLARREGLPPTAALRGIVVSGVLWFGVYNLALNDAERHVDAGTAAMLVNVAPVLIAVLAGLFLGEGFPRRLLAGCAVAFAGAIVIGVATSHHGLQASTGALLCLVAAVAYAVALVFQKPALQHASALQVTWLACTIGAVVCLPFAPQLVHRLGTAHASAIGWAVYLGIGPTAIGFATWAYALARTDAGRLGVSTYLVPPLAIAFSWALLGQTPPLLALAGGALCLTGVAVTRTARRPPRFRRPPAAQRAT